MKVVVVGIGNVLMCDDGLGPWVLSSLEAAWEFPPGVTLLDAGTPGLDLTFLIEGADALIAVDAIRAQGPAGEVRSYRRAELCKGSLPLVMSPHEPSLREALMRLDFVGSGPRDVFVIGAIPARIGAGTSLSEPVRRAVSHIEAQVLRELERLGVLPTPRTALRRFGPWWEARSATCASTAGAVPASGP